MIKINSQKPITIVLGLGKSGIAAARLLNAEKEKVIVIEKSEEAKFLDISKTIKEEGIKVEHEQNLEFKNLKTYLPSLQSVVVSPGIPWNNPTLNKLRKEGVTITSEISIAWEKLNHIPWIGVTGTNGKTTVTYMLQHILEANNVHSLMGGNMGIPACQIALDCKDNSKSQPEYLVIELSSYQLETLSNFKPHIAIWTTFTADHLERHGTLENYFNIKSRLFKEASLCIYNQDDPYLYSQQRKLPKGIWVSMQNTRDKNNIAEYWVNKKGKICEMEEEIVDTSVFRLQGKHNLQNLLLVTAAARKIGISGKEIEHGLKTFKGVEHRLEKIDIFNEISIFNDSKATNYEAATTALISVEGPLIVIAGGESKQGNANCWIKALRGKAKAVILFGKSKYEIFELIKKSGFEGILYTCENLNQATDECMKMAMDLKVRSILFSPACASFDQYKNFEERGNHFKKLIADNLRKSF